MDADAAGFGRGDTGSPPVESSNANPPRISAATHSAHLEETSTYFQSGVPNSEYQADDQTSKFTIFAKQPKGAGHLPLRFCSTIFTAAIPFILPFGSAAPHSLHSAIHTYV
jgi:hypothetical protein